MALHAAAEWNSAFSHKRLSSRACVKKISGASRISDHRLTSAVTGPPRLRNFFALPAALGGAAILLEPAQELFDLLHPRDAHGAAELNGLLQQRQSVFFVPQSAEKPPQIT